MIHSLLTPVPGWHISAHARGRALERGICDRDLRFTVEQPDYTYPQADSYGSDRRVHVRGEWAVVVNPTEHTVITVLYQDHTRWPATDTAMSGSTRMRGDHDDPRELAGAIRAQVPMTAGTLTTTMSRADHRIGLFLRDLTRNGARCVPGFSASTHPQLISADTLHDGDHATIGTPSAGCPDCSSSTNPSSSKRRLAAICSRRTSRSRCGNSTDGSRTVASSPSRVTLSESRSCSPGASSFSAPERSHCCPACYCNCGPAAVRQTYLTSSRTRSSTSWPNSERSQRPSCSASPRRGP